MQSERPQAGRDALRLMRVFRPGEPDVLVATDEGEAIGKSIRSFKKSFPNRFSDDRTLWTSRVTLASLLLSRPRQPWAFPAPR